MKKCVYIESLGCAKNQVDSELLIGMLEADGFVYATNPEPADLIVVNTCGFIEQAKQESIETALELKRSYPEKRIIMTGCLALRYREALQAALPEIEIVTEKITSAAFPSLLRDRLRLKTPPPAAAAAGRHLLSLPGSAYVRIADGCGNNCTYCAIPLIRGPLESRPRNDIIREVTGLRAAGITEINLIAQDTASYGGDRGEYELVSLLRELDRIDGRFWIRLLYLHPDHLTRRIITAIAGSEKILPYFDIPFQHGSARILAAMNRAGSRQSYARTVRSIRRLVPHAVIRTTFLVGFPGETESDFQELLSFQESIRPSWAGVFCYSREEGTIAHAMQPPVPKKTAERRRKIIEEKQTKITEAWIDTLTGMTTDVLIEEPVAGENLSLGRAFFQAPEVDGLVVVEGEKPVPGSLVRVKLEKRSGIDLKAVRCDT